MEDVEVYNRPTQPRTAAGVHDEKSKEFICASTASYSLQPARVARQGLRIQASTQLTSSLMTEPLNRCCWVRVTDRRIQQDFAEQLRIMADEPPSIRRGRRHRARTNQHV